MQAADFRPPTPVTGDDPFLAPGKGGTEGGRRQRGWQQPPWPPGTIPPQPAQLAPTGFSSSSPADPLHHKDHGSSFLLQGLFFFFFSLLFASWTNANPRQEQSPTLTRCPQLPGLQMCFSFLVWDPLPTRGYKGMEEAQQAISSQQKIFPHVAFLQCFEGRFSLESSMCQQHGLLCTSLHGKSLPYKGTSPDWRSLLLFSLLSSSLIGLAGLKWEKLWKQ